MVLTVSEIIGVLLDYEVTPETTMLIELATQDAKMITGFIILPEALNSTVAQMVMELINKRGSEGIKSQSFEGISESYVDGYSQHILNTLNAYKASTMTKKIRMI